MPSEPRTHERWREADRAALWHPFTQARDWADEAFPVIVAGEGCELVDADGTRYLDGSSSLWCNLHGHRVPEIDDALRDQLDRVAHSTLLGLASTPSIRLAEELLALAPGPFAKVFYSDSGSEAVEVALKMAFQFWRQTEGPGTRRTRYLCLRGAYHGDTVGSVSVGGIDLFQATFQPLLFPVARLEAPAGPSAEARAADAPRCLKRLDLLLRDEGQGFAALVMEPGVQGAAGIRPYPDGFTRAVVERAREAGLLVILDEVATGFGRSGELFASQREGVQADLLCLAKGLTGGYLPLAATLATRPVHEAFLGAPEDHRTFFHGHTYTGNALACAAARASLALCGQSDFLPRARALGDALAAGLEPLAAHPHVLELRRYGAMFGVELVARRAGPVPFEESRRTGHRAALAARERGALLRPLGDALVLLPPLAMSADEAARLAAITCEAVQEATLS